MIGFNLPDGVKLRIEYDIVCAEVGGRRYISGKGFGLDPSHADPPRVIFLDTFTLTIIFHRLSQVFYSPISEAIADGASYHGSQIEANNINRR